MKLLVSSCNAGTNYFALSVFNTETEQTRNVDLPDICLGCAGIAKHPNGYALMLQCQGYTTRFALLDRKLNLVTISTVGLIKDGHGIIWNNGSYYVASAGNNMAVRLAFREGVYETIAAQVLDADVDLCHVNSVALHNDELFVTMFGKREQHQSWGGIEGGSVIKCSDMSVVQDGLFHPHSLNFINGKLSYCDSRRNRFVLGDKEVVLDGYTRGVTWTDDNIFVATSNSRNVSRSTGELINNDTSIRASIYKLDYELNVIQRYSVGTLKEIFELEVL